MKEGSSVMDLSKELLRQKEAKVDYRGDTKNFTMMNMNDELRFHISGHGDRPVNDHAHQQIAEKIGIPGKYYNLMLREAPELLTQNVNHWFQARSRPMMVRTLDGRVRAFLSNKYRTMDHYDLAQAVLPVLASSGADLMSCEITEDRMYLKGVIQSVQQTVPPPDGHYGRGYQAVTVSPGIVVSNSETGAGALAVQTAVHYLGCTNMAVWAQQALRKRHLGRSMLTDSDDVYQYFSDQTRELTDAALWAQVKDLVTGALEGDLFAEHVEELRKARYDHIEDAVGAVEKIAQNNGMAQEEQKGVLQYLIEGGDLTKFGLSNAVTRYSQDVESYDRASALEQLGGDIITMPQRDWATISLN